MMFWLMFLGHLIGDYLFQSDGMARGKIEKGPLGSTVCAFHCLVYSVSVILVMQIPNITKMDMGETLLMLGMVYLTHYPIDRWSLAKWWLAGLGKFDAADAPVGRVGDRVLHRFFYWLVYVIVDNTMHLILMTIGFVIFFPEFIQ